MKEAAQPEVATATPNTRNGNAVPIVRKIHERGDKVVVNGAKQSLLAIIKKYTCGCSKHTLEKLAIKFLNQNKITASYDLVVWMFIFIRKSSDPDTYSDILKDYLRKMRIKEDQEENHESSEYVLKKKRTILKFIRSAETLLDDQLTLATIQTSVEALYSKGKSKENAFSKIKSYLQKSGFQGNWSTFDRNPCNITAAENVYHQEDGINQLINSDFLSFQLNSSEKSEEHIQQSSQKEQSSAERQPIQEARDQSNMSLRQSPMVQSNDLFDELIYDPQSAYSLMSEYFQF